LSASGVSNVISNLASVADLARFTTGLASIAAFAAPFDTVFFIFGPVWGE
jgi:hypothetical protein